MTDSFNISELHKKYPIGSLWYYRIEIPGMPELQLTKTGKVSVCRVVGYDFAERSILGPGGAILHVELPYADNQEGDVYPHEIVGPVENA